MALLVLRATAVPGAYVIVAKSARQQLTAGVPNTFSVNVAVRGGDFLGLWSGGARCATVTGNPFDLNPYQGSSPEPAVGDTVIPEVFDGDPAEHLRHDHELHGSLQERRLAELRRLQEPG